MTALAQDTGIDDGGKNAPQPAEPAESPGSFQSITPEPSSKNAAFASGAAAGEGTLIQPAEGTKNSHANPEMTLISPGKEAAYQPWPPPPDEQGAAEGGKNNGPSAEPDAVPGPFDIRDPEAGSKNYSSDEATGSSGEEGRSILSDGDGRNLSQQLDAGDLSPALAAAMGVTGSLITCSDSGNLSWTTTSGSFSVVRRCRLRVPQPGWAFISASGSLGRANGECEAQFEGSLNCPYSLMAVQWVLFIMAEQPITRSVPQAPSDPIACTFQNVRSAELGVWIVDFLLLKCITLSGSRTIRYSAFASDWAGSLAGGAHEPRVLGKVRAVP